MLGADSVTSQRAEADPVWSPQLLSCPYLSSDLSDYQSSGMLTIMPASFMRNYSNFALSNRFLLFIYFALSVNLLGSF